MKKITFAILAITLAMAMQSSFAQLSGRDAHLTARDTLPKRDTLKSQKPEHQKQREDYQRERQRLERERERLQQERQRIERERERLSRQLDSLDRKYAISKPKKPSFGQRVDSTAKVVGNKGAELGAKAVAGIKDRSLENVKGPKGEKVYVDKYDRRYYIDKEGKRIYLKKLKKN